MGRNKPAHKRLVSPSEFDYQPNENGDKVLLGIYSNAQRNKFMSVHISLCLTRHPEKTNKQAKQLAFQKWRQFVYATMDDQARKSAYDNSAPEQRKPEQKPEVKKGIQSEQTQ